jgi:hypothetical protein
MKCVPRTPNQPPPQNQILARRYPQKGGRGEGVSHQTKVPAPHRRIGALNASGDRRLHPWPTRRPAQTVSPARAPAVGRSMESECTSSACRMSSGIPDRRQRASKHHGPEQGIRAQQECAHPHAQQNEQQGQHSNHTGHQRNRQTGASVVRINPRFRGNCASRKIRTEIVNR